MEPKEQAVASLKTYIADLDEKLRSVHQWQEERRKAVQALAVLEQAPGTALLESAVRQIEAQFTRHANIRLQRRGKQPNPKSKASRYVRAAKVAFDSLGVEEATFPMIRAAMPEYAENLYVGDNAIASGRKTLQRKCAEIGLEYDDEKQVFRKKGATELASAS